MFGFTCENLSGVGVGFICKVCIHILCFDGADMLFPYKVVTNYVLLLGLKPLNFHFHILISVLILSDYIQVISRRGHLFVFSMGP